MTSPSLQDQFNLRMACIRLATKMTHNGMPIHEHNREALRVPAQARLDEASAACQEAALELGWGRQKAVFTGWTQSEDELTEAGKPRKVRQYVAQNVPFNPNSGKHWTELLIERVGMRAIKFSKKTREPAWDEEVLGDLIANKDQRISRLARYGQKAKQAQKELSNYIEGLPVWTDGRIHPYWAAQDAATTRWTCRGPAAQTIPKHLRGIISAPRCAHCGRWGWVVLSDYSQQEPRILTCQSRDPILADCYQTKRDVYRIVGQSIFGSGYAGITANQRQASKVLFLSMAYGAGVQTQLVALHGASEAFRSIDERQLRKMNDAFFKEHHWIKAYHYDCENQARAGKLVEPLSGHTLHTFGVLDPSLAYNFRIQTAGAYQTSTSLLIVDGQLVEGRDEIYANNHDEIVTGTFREDPMEIVQIHREAMERPWTINGVTIPFVTETKVSSDSIGHALEVSPEGKLKAGSLREITLGFRQALVEQPACRHCLGA